MGIDICNWNQGLLIAKDESDVTVHAISHLHRSSFEEDAEWGGDKKLTLGASLVAQWLRIRLLMQGTQVRALVWEDPTCRGATRPVSHNY